MRTFPLSTTGILIPCLLAATADTALAQACSSPVAGDPVQIQVPANFLSRLWYKRNLIRALFSSTVPVEGRYESATADTLVLARSTALVEGKPFGPTEFTAFDRSEVRRVRKVCLGDPSWDGAVGGAISSVGILFQADIAITAALVAIVAPLSGGGVPHTVFFPIARYSPLGYVAAASAGLIVGWFVDWVTPGWVDVGVLPGPPGRAGMSVGVRLPLL